MAERARHDLLARRSDAGSTTNWNAFVEQQRDHQPADHAEDDQRVGVLELVALEPLRVQHEPPVEREADRAEHEEREHVLRQRVEQVERLSAEAARTRTLERLPLSRISTVPAVSTMKPQKIERVHRAGDRVSRKIFVCAMPIGDHVAQPHERIVRRDRPVSRSACSETSRCTLSAKKPAASSSTTRKIAFWVCMAPKL